jgi:hypothetical protein
MARRRNARRSPDAAAVSSAVRTGGAQLSSSAVARADDALSFADWRRRVFETYRIVRNADDSPPRGAAGAPTGTNCSAATSSRRYRPTSAPTSRDSRTSTTTSAPGCLRRSRRSSQRRSTSPPAAARPTAPAATCWTPSRAQTSVSGKQLVLDFNFAYNPSCSYDPRWVRPPAPPANRLPVGIRAGERTG